MDELAAPSAVKFRRSEPRKRRTSDDRTVAVSCRMKPSLTRKSFLHYGAMTIGAAVVAPRLFAQAPVASPPSIPDRGSQIASELVKEFVIAGHANLDKVRELLATEPALLNGTWDWGKGDFETALG